MCRSITTQSLECLNNTKGCHACVCDKQNSQKVHNCDESLVDGWMAASPYFTVKSPGSLRGSWNADGKKWNAKPKIVVQI